MTLLIFAVILIWLIMGFSGLCFWWLKDYDKLDCGVIGIIGAILAGPFSWLIGYLIHGK